MTDAQLYGSSPIQAESLLRAPSFGLRVTTEHESDARSSRLVARSYLQVGFEVRVMTVIVIPIIVIPIIDPTSGKVL